MPPSQHTNTAAVELPGQSNKRLVACGGTCCSGLCDNLVFAYETCGATVGMLPHKRVHIGVRASTSRHVFRSKAHKRTLHVKSQVEMCLLSPLFALAGGTPRPWCSRMKRARAPEGQCVECVGVSLVFIFAGFDRGMLICGLPKILGRIMLVRLACLTLSLSNSLTNVTPNSDVPYFRASMRGNLV